MVTDANALSLKTIGKAEGKVEEIRQLVHQGTPLDLAARRRKETLEERAERLRFTNRAISIGAWFFWMLVSVITGYVMLIADNHGFGVGYDYLVCLLWGFGIGIGGQQAQNLGPSAVAGRIGISFPKIPSVR